MSGDDNKRPRARRAPKPAAQAGGAAGGNEAAAEDVPVARAPRMTAAEAVRAGLDAGPYGAADD